MRRDEILGLAIVLLMALLLLAITVGASFWIALSGLAWYAKTVLFSSLALALTIIIAISSGM